MKTKSLLLLFISIYLTSACFSQENTTEHTVSVFAGSSFWNLFFTENAESARFNREINISPVLGCSYKIGRENVFDFGIMTTYQRYRMFSPDQEFYLNTGNIIFRDYELIYDRLYVGFHGSYTFLRKKHFQLFTGIGGGFQMMQRNTDNIAEIEDLPRFRRFNVVPQLTLLGFRYVTQYRLALVSELALGSPYLTQIGLQYRFSK